MRDNKLFGFLSDELERQNNSIELIASENFASKEVRELCGSILTLYIILLIFFKY